MLVLESWSGFLPQVAYAYDAQTAVHSDALNDHLNVVTRLSTTFSLLSCLSGHRA